MELSSPRFMLAHGVLGLGKPLPSQPDLDEAFIAAVSDEFPNLVSRQSPLVSMPTPAPRLVLSSTSSQLVVSPAQLDFEVRFYGDYLSDVDRGLEYVNRKLETIRKGLASIDQTPATIGVIASFNFSFAEINERSAAHILKTHLRSEVDPDLIQDAVARLALRIRDTYFLNLTVANYEARAWERPVLPGAQQTFAVKPWEGTVQDVGVELTVDINNGLEGRLKEADAEVTGEGVRAVLALLGRVAQEVGPSFVERGEIKIDQLIEEPA
jgi:hypothetical protein